MDLKKFKNYFDKKIKELCSEHSIEHFDIITIHKVLKGICESIPNNLECKNVVASNIFQRTIKEIYNYNQDQLDALYMIYFYKMLVREAEYNDQILPIYLDFKEFYIYDEKEIYKVHSNWYLPFYEQYKAIKNGYDYERALEIKEAHNQGLNYLEKIW